MHNNYWSLILFTLLSQFGIGLILFLTAIHFFQNNILQSFQSGFHWRSPEFIALSVTLLAIILSLLHLGSPLHATNALNNLKTSWLSREILGISVFAFGVFLVFVFRMINLPVSWLIPAYLIFASVAGIALVLVMSKIYLIPTIPSWNTWYTPASFALTAIVLGSIGFVGFMFGNFSGPSPAVQISVIQKAAWIICIILVIQLIMAFFHQSGLTRLETMGIGQKSFGEGTYHTLYLIR